VNSYERLKAMAEAAPLVRAGKIQVTPIIPTGIWSLDKVLHGGIQQNKLAVFAARTSHGKTATAVRLAVNMVTAGLNVNVVWCEDDETEFDLRALGALVHKPIPAMSAAHRSGQIDTLWDNLDPARREAWKRLRTHCFDGTTVEQVADLIRSLPRGEVVIIDHLGELDYGPGPKFETMGQGLRLIRRAAREARVLAICMTQLNRDWDRRKSASQDPDKVRPVLSDIENSGQIEQVARVCILCERRHIRQGDEEVPTGEYVYHVWKPSVAIARCRWDERTDTPDNHDPVTYEPIEENDD
jgi:replicative DNA helicase